ncbi:ribosome biogenesis protein WDR12 homolog [Chenopodium quinoa]|uniref:ribosome biogenesis protein WDR12 homolog n=1 Tax=Chenopodium quinoa TaxID=63459 RepID=UPI000B7995D6|nr:ribosome biogenesis protein WDR12 homolog [Chenopodium quinoa]
MDMETDETVKRVHVRFVTHLEQHFKVPSNAIAIPSDLTRFGLSSIVNNLLKAVDSDWEPEPFDFLIDGELVRLSLEEFLLAKRISAEKVVEIEYIRAVVPRKQEEPCLHDDWVSAIDGSDPRFVLTGCYDGLGRIWTGAETCTHKLKGHTGALTSLCIINGKGSDNGNNICVATTSKDQSLRLWQFDAENASNNPATITASKVLRGHSAAVECVSSQQSGNMVCSGSWDSTINLWQANLSDADGDLASIKKRKKSGVVNESLSEGEAVTTLVGHTNCVSSVLWAHDETIYSASWDHSIRIWDVETGNATWSMFSGKVLNCIDVGGESSGLVSAGGSDGTLRIWDPRRRGTLAPVYQFSSHTNWISSCKWHKKSWFHLVSASYDGKVMLWDLRTAWPLSVIDSHNDKVLSVDWWKGNSVVSGGADSKMCISSEIPVM